MQQTTLTLWVLLRTESQQQPRQRAPAAPADVEGLPAASEMTAAVLAAPAIVGEPPPGGQEAQPLAAAEPPEGDPGGTAADPAAS